MESRRIVRRIKLENFLEYDRMTIDFDPWIFRKWQLWHVRIRSTSKYQVESFAGWRIEAEVIVALIVCHRINELAQIRAIGTGIEPTRVLRRVNQVQIATR